jgi:LuxR family maltose regulon positive regulatory protein
VTFQILATKLYIPPIRSKLVSRSRLLARLNEGLDCKLSLVSAPAGFGKTTLLSEWVSRCDRPVIWISLDESENDLNRFLAYLIRGLEQVAPDIDEGRIDVLNSPHPFSQESLLTDLINDLSDVPDPFLVVLDDYHVIRDRDIHKAVTFLLENQPPGMHLVIASRADPPWPMARLRSRCEMTELRTADLRFTESESASFLNEVMELGLSSDAVVDLDTRTEGWIAGLQLAALSMRGRGDSRSFIHSFAGSHRFVLDYLMEEVLNQQPEDIQSFLLKTSILNRLTEPLCDAITGGDESRDMMYELDQANMFLIALDDERRWYRYHQLFADLLRSRLEQDHPDQVPELHRLASAWFESEALIEEAIYHAFKARDMEHAADLVENHAMAVISQSKARTLLSWIEALPDPIIRQRPMLCAYLGWSLYWTGQRERVEECLIHAEQSLQDPGHKISDSNRSLIEGYIAAIRAYLAITDEDIFRVIEMSQQALKNLPENNYMSGIAAVALGVTYWGLGDVKRSQEAFQQAVEICWNGGYQNLALTAACYVGIQQEKQGQLQNAFRTYSEALDSGTRSGNSWIPLGCFPAERLGNVWREWNELDKATRYVDEGLKRCEQLGHPDILADGYLSKIRLQISTGDWDGARETLLKLDRLAEQATLDPWATTWADECRIMLWLRDGNLEEAGRWVETSRIEMDSELSYMHDLHHMNLVRILIAQGEKDQQALKQAQEWLPRLSEAARDAGWVLEEIKICILQALAFATQKDEENALESLAQALVLAEPGGYMRLFLDEGDAMEVLLRKANAAGISGEYTGLLLADLDEPGAERRTTPVGAVPSRSLYRQSTQEDASTGLVEPLTEREMQVLRMLQSELSVPEIADELVIGVSTVRTHVKNIYGKLGVHSRYQAVSRSRQLRLLN